MTTMTQPLVCSAELRSDQAQPALRRRVVSTASFAYHTGGLRLALFGGTTALATLVIFVSTGSLYAGDYLSFLRDFYLVLAYWPLALGGAFGTLNVFGLLLTTMVTAAYIFYVGLAFVGTRTRRLSVFLTSYVLYTALTVVVGFPQFAYLVTM